MNTKKNVQPENKIGYFNTCFDNIDLNLAVINNKKCKLEPEFSFFYEYAHDRTILSIALDESGTFMTTCSADHTLRVHNLKTLNTIKELYHKKCGHYDWVNKAFFNKKNEVLSGGLDGKLCLWATGNLCKIPKRTHFLNAVEYSEQQKKVKEVHFTSSTNAITCKELYAHHSTISDMKFDKIKDLCITSSYDKTLKLFDTNKFKELAMYNGSHTAPITKFLWLRDQIISADKNGSLCVFDVGTFQEKENAKNTHQGNIGALNYFYLYEKGSKSMLEHNLMETENRRRQNIPKDSERSKLKSSATISSEGLYESYRSHSYEPMGKVPLIITGGQTDGILKVRDFRIFSKYVSCKQIHTASINAIVTYNLHCKTYIISCSADGYCYQFEINGICSSSLKDYLKKIYVNEPILTARYVGNHLVLVGTCYGNLFLLNFEEPYNNEESTLHQQFQNKEMGKGTNHEMIEVLKNQELQLERKIPIGKEHCKDILWGFGACKKGGINCIECSYIYDATKPDIRTLELYNIISAGDDGIPCFMFIPNSFM